MGLEALTAAIDDLVDADPSTLADGRSVVALQRQLARLDAVATRATGHFDASGKWALNGARNATTWLAVRCHLPRAAARRLVSRARTMRHLPLFAETWTEGSISGAHLDAVSAVRRPSTEATLERDEELLVGQAKRLRFDHFARALNYWDQLADPDGTEESAEERRARRDVYLAPSFSGMFLGHMTLDPISGAIVSGQLERIEHELFLVEWAEARTELGREPTVADLRRNPAQRHADALVEMAVRSGTAPADGRRPAPLFTVLVGWETLAGRTCELAQGIALTPGSLVPWLDRTYLERAVFEPGGRVEVSTTARLFTGGTRRAIELRDRECTHPVCDIDGEHCQVDHIIPYSEGGETSQRNARLLCGPHNRERNQRPPPDD
ncbi:MAG TPA: DUF222 domain-containing protein [Acidimicrobiales bacterium]|jgi:hypothetical protein|nr:DUF222 domain-containing protein [Acidimicrobiales bacterium]